MPEIVAYGLFGVNLNAIFSIFRIAVTVPILYFSLRIPFKRNYHWMFIVLSIAFLWFLFCTTLYQLTTTTSSFSIGYWLNFWMGGKVQGLLVFQFVVYFVSRRVTLWKKLAIAGGYVFVAATVWVPLLVDPRFLFGSKPTLTSLGWSVGPGTGDTYLRPDGIDIFVTLMLIPSFLLLIQYYRSEKSPLIRGQTLYIIVGLVLIFAGSYQSYISRSLIPSGNTVPNIQNLISAPGDLILLLGLRKKGFYSVTPVAETAAGPVPVVYPLEEARSYLAYDTKVSFEAFTSLVRNGHEGLSITRIFPDQVRKDYGIQSTPIRWLAEERSDYAIPPSDLLGLSLTVKDFLQKATKPVVMIQGIEYLATYNGFTPILRLIQGLTEVIAAKGGILLLPVVPKSLDERDEALLIADTTPFPSPSTSMK